MSDAFSSDTILRLVSAHVPVDPSRFHFWRIPTGKFNTSYRIDGNDRPLVLRIAPPDDAGFVFYEKRMMAQEPEIHELIRGHTGAPVPEILVYDNARSLIDRDFLLMDALPGRPLSELDEVSPAFYNRVLYQVGQALREIHSITTDQYGYLGPHRPMEPQANWNDAFMLMWNKMVDDVVRCGHYDEWESSWMRRLLDENLRHFDRETPSMLLHMDVWGQNILVDEQGNLTGLLDFDRALWGDPEIEFAVLDYCGISEPAFWHGYGEERDTSKSAQIRTLFYLLYEVQKYIVIRHYRQGDCKGALRYKSQVMQMAGQLE
jgi:aminoglycoside phosphotransferase (APT) family kinase protein